MSENLRGLWDFDDLDSSETRFSEQLDREESDARRAEVLTQLARAHGLRGDFEACARVLDEAERLGGDDPAANVRLELERGRMFRSSGGSEAALPLFESAFDRAVEAREHYLAGDAAHMCAISTDDAQLAERWTERGLELASREPDAAYWSGPLLNNLGWSAFEGGDFERALALFERALEARERDPENAEGIAWARYAVAEAQRELGRAEAAEATMAPALVWAQQAGKPDDYFTG
jgi:tetratricopeptide (TPR) repeat protein